jgi:hypothetical protein
MNARANEILGYAYVADWQGEFTGRAERAIHGTVLADIAALEDLAQSVPQGEHLATLVRLAIDRLRDQSDAVEWTQLMRR